MNIVIHNGFGTNIHDGIHVYLKLVCEVDVEDGHSLLVVSPRPPHSELHH